MGDGGEESLTPHMSHAKGAAMNTVHVYLHARKQIVACSQTEGSKQSHIKVHFKGIIAKVQCQRFNVKGSNIKGSNIKGSNIKGSNIKGSNIKALAIPGKTATGVHVPLFDTMLLHDQPGQGEGPTVFVDSHTIRQPTASSSSPCKITTHYISKQILTRNTSRRHHGRMSETEYEDVQTEHAEEVEYGDILEQITQQITLSKGPQGEEQSQESYEVHLDVLSTDYTRRRSTDSSKVSTAGDLFSTAEEFLSTDEEIAQKLNEEEMTKVAAREVKEKFKSSGNMSSNTPDYIYPIIVPSDSDVEDAFSSTTTPNYTSASPDYSLASPGNTSPDPSCDNRDLAGVFLAIVDAFVRSEFEISSWRGARVGVRTYLLGGAIDGSEANGIIRDPKLELESSRFTFDLVPLSYESVDVVIGENFGSWRKRTKEDMMSRRSTKEDELRLCDIFVSKEEYESHVKMIVESLKEEKMYVKFSNNVEAEQAWKLSDVEGIKCVMS
ncbi:hypothetical protein Tco_0086084 [Tanacetum coccineum]